MESVSFSASLGDDKAWGEEGISRISCLRRETIALCLRGAFHNWRNLRTRSTNSLRDVTLSSGIVDLHILDHTLCRRRSASLSHTLSLHHYREIVTPDEANRYRL